MYICPQNVNFVHSKNILMENNNRDTFVTECSLKTIAFKMEFPIFPGYMENRRCNKGLLYRKLLGTLWEKQLILINQSEENAHANIKFASALRLSKLSKKKIDWNSIIKLASCRIWNYFCALMLSWTRIILQYLTRYNVTYI